MGVGVRPGLRRLPGARPAPDPGLSPDLLADLSDWNLHLHERSFTQLSVDMLLRDLRRTVPTAVGYTLVLGLATGSPEVSITVAPERLTRDDVRSSIAFDLPGAHDVTARATFYASLEHAFDALADLLGASATFGSGAVQLGGAPEQDVEPGVHGLEDHSRVNYAVGVLLARGKSFDQAHQHLRDLVEQHGSLQSAAEHVLLTFNA
jgi:hypothetical protein